MAWTYFAIYAVLAMLISVSASIAVFVLAMNKRLSVDAALLFVVATAGALSYAFSGRELGGVAELLQNPTETVAGRIANSISLGLCLVAAVQTGMRGVVSRSSVAIALATLQYYFICFIFPITFDRWFVFDHKLLYPIIGLMIIVMPAVQSTQALAVNFARAATVPSLLSLLLIPIDYKAAVLEKYQSLLPFFTGRLYGATPHPNVLGTICSFAILLIVAFPPKRRRERLLLLLINCSALILCQSKTSWLATMLGVAVLLLPRLRGFRGRIPSWLYVTVMLALCSIPAALSVLNKSAYDLWSSNENIGRIATLSGRTDIWHATLFLVKAHPLLGPGWATYVVYMQSLFPNLIANPHNLFLSIFVQAGVVGIVSFVIYLATLIIVAANLTGRARLFALACVGLIVLRGLSESFSLQQAFVAPTFWTLLLYMRLMAVAAAEERASKAEAVTPQRPDAH